MIASDKEILYIYSIIENAVDKFHNFWPMTGFIHHNPLHGFENLPFEKAVKEASNIFHSRLSLSREEYQEYLKEGKIDKGDLRDEIERFLKKHTWHDKRLSKLFYNLSLSTKNMYIYDEPEADLNSELIKDIYIELLAKKSEKNIYRKSEKLLKSWTICDAVDRLFGTNLSEILNEKTSKILMRFLDEGQAVLPLPYKERGMFYAWKHSVMLDHIFFKKSDPLCRLLKKTDTAEDIIYYVINELKIPKEQWETYFTLEFSKQHGWTGFLRWRSKNSSYKFQKTAPAYLEDLLAIKLYYTYMLIKTVKKEYNFYADYENLVSFLHQPEGIMRVLYHSKQMLKEYVMSFQEWLRVGDKDEVLKLYQRYIKDEIKHESRCEAEFLYNLLKNEDKDTIEYFKTASYSSLLEHIRLYEENEGFIWLRAMEKRYMKELMYESALVFKDEKKEEKDAQLFFCIDVRSESIRRAVESTGKYETFGIAGFFGVPLKFIDVKNRTESNLCPAIIKPKNIVYKFENKQKNDSKELIKVLKHIYHDLKEGVLSPYIAVETIGILFGFDFLGKTFYVEKYMPFRKKYINSEYSGEWIIDKYPKKFIVQQIETLQRAIIKEVLKKKYQIKAQKYENEIEEIRKMAVSKFDCVDLNDKTNKPQTGFGATFKLMNFEEIELIKLLREKYKISHYDMSHQIEKMKQVGFSFEEQLFYAENALKIVGIDNEFAKYVIFMGHKSQSENNPYESALDCGACGGNSSDTNARVLAYILNKPDIKKALKNSGINIPPKTIFISGIHNTVTDEITLEKDNLPKEYVKEIDKIENDLKKATEISAYERSKKLPFVKNLSRKKALKFIQKNAYDWSQPRPEWGLSSNHSFFIGKRELSQNIKLENRAFLHSYNYKKDKTGSFLEIILSGALVVGEWINMEHFFSSIDNVAFGSESKVYHNVVGKFGVISGNLSDLRTGLAAQSVHLEGKPYHEPIRLITFVQAPFEKYKKVVDKIHKVSQLVYNGWIRMIFVDNEKRAFYCYCYEDNVWNEMPFEKVLRREI